MEKKKNVPVLRFPEFSGEWGKKDLKELTDIYDGTHQTPNYVESGIPFYSVEHVTANDFENTKFITDEVFEKENKKVKIERGDILMTKIGDIGTSRFIDWDVNASFYVSLALIKQSKKYNSQFFNYYIATKKFQTELWNRTIHVAFPKKINLGEIGNCELLLPNSFEQQKIALFISSADDKQKALKKKKTLLEQYKKGMMQKIFSQELRYKDDKGNAFPKWQKKKLGEVADKIIYGMNSAAIEYNGIHKYLRITDIDENTRTFLPNPLTSPNGITEEKYQLQEGDLVFARTGASVGKSYLYNKKDGNLYFAGFLIKFSITKANPYFIYTQTLRESYNKWIQLMSMRSGQPGVNAEEYKTFSFLLPCLEEQTKIANFLSAIDDKINLCNTQIEKTEQWKKGLLQKMFV